MLAKHWVTLLPPEPESDAEAAAAAQVLAILHRLDWPKRRKALELAAMSLGMADEFPGGCDRRSTGSSGR
jgi:hypothetical protein